MKKGFAWWELLVVIALLVVVLTILLPSLGRPQSVRRPSCQNNLKMWGLVFKMYSNEAKDQLYPHMLGMNHVVDCDDPAYPVTNIVGFAAATLDVPVVYPEYLSDPSVAFCPSSDRVKAEMVKNPKTGSNEFGIPCDKSKRGMRLADASYFYLGWVFDLASCNENSVQIEGVTGPRQMVEALLPAIEPWRYGWVAKTNVDTLDGDLNAATDGFGNGRQGKVVHRLREGIERVLVTDASDGSAVRKAQGSVWIMADTMQYAATKKGKGSTVLDFNHTPAGCNVLSLDGHVEFQKYDVCGGAQAGGDVAGPVNMHMAGFLNTAFGMEAGNTAR